MRVHLFGGPQVPRESQCCGVEKRLGEMEGVYKLFVVCIDEIGEAGGRAQGEGPLASTVVGERRTTLCGSLYF